MACDFWLLNTGYFEYVATLEVRFSFLCLLQVAVVCLFSEFCIFVRSVVFATEFCVPLAYRTTAILAELP